MLQCAAFGVGYARSALFEDSVGLLGRWDALIRLEYILRILQAAPEARCVLCPYVLCEFVSQIGDVSPRLLTQVDRGY